MKLKIMATLIVVLIIGAGILARNDNGLIFTKSGTYNIESNQVENLLSEVYGLSEKLSQQQDLSQAQLEENKRSVVVMIKAIEERLQSLEANHKVMMDEKMIAAENQSQASDKMEFPDHYQNSYQNKEIDIGGWIDESIETDNIDTYASQKALSELTETLTRLSGVNVESLQCGDGFCRAQLIQEDGQSPDISKVIGLPPFTGGGFGRTDETGKLAFYFTQSGVTMEDLESRITTEELN